MIKLFVKFIAMGVIFSSALFADMVVPATALPQNAQAFISSNFQGANIVYVEQDYNDFEVRLSNGVKIDFYRDGTWKDIESYGGINPSILPAPVAQTIAKTYPNIAIVKVDKEWNGFEVKMANMLKIYLDINGNLLGQKYDD
ncbi:hypothetical protein CCY99_05310 [Helicobacter sp. 16-1353]|uniref:PepSY-like domain-containing protein n=1 Tax=Helicobacter sp. 16-1353 TaxID=2004996 RepID=UPI000DCDE941|nr:PepSY-like domain-containing protein [Helicobacter sp. 16-1353]RAX54098.1 hypothetical protein CCY99_05310 [Helicobacter sp. 16-1353]